MGLLNEQNRERVKAIYPGSFDPVTMGHLDIIRRSARLFSEIIVLVANHPKKACLFSLGERVQMMRDATLFLSNVSVESADTLTVDYAHRAGAQVLLRGVRAVSDFEYEYAMASMNRALNDSIETFVVFSSPEYAYISSRTVKEAWQFGASVDAFVPANVAEALKSKFEIDNNKAFENNERNSYD